MSGSRTRSNMRLAEEFLSHAGTLVHRPGRPRQINLRRSISAAYYSVFHLLTAEAVDRLVPSSPAYLRPQATRSLQHGEMKEICADLLKPSLPLKLRLAFPVAITPELRSLCDAFVKLQDGRHSADYDSAWRLSQSDALRTLASAQAAFRNWQTICNTDEANAFLTALVFAKRWNR
jgi:hypothetical protein